MEEVRNDVNSISECITAESLKRHERTHSEDYQKKSHVCHICEKSFAYPSFLAEHMKNHTGEKPHLCSVCGKGFRQSGALHFHQRIHTGYKPFKCEICNENFKSQSRYMEFILDTSCVM